MLKQLVIVLTEPKNMLILHTIIHCELFSWFISQFLTVRSSTLLMLALGKCMHTASLH